MTSISNNEAREVTGGARRSSLLSELPRSGGLLAKEPIATSLAPFTVQEEFYFTAGLRWAALRMEVLCSGNGKQDPRVCELLKIYEGVFRDSGCLLPSPSAPQTNTTAAQLFFAEKDKLVQKAARLVEGLGKKGDGAVRYFDLLRSLESGFMPEHLSARGKREVRRLQGYASSLLSYISGRYSSLVSRLIRNQEDFSAGYLGLVKGLSKFQPDRGFRVVTFVEAWIRDERAVITHYERHSIKRPKRISEAVKAIRKLLASRGAVKIDFDDPQLVQDFADLRKISLSKAAKLVALVKAAVGANAVRGHGDYGEPLDDVCTSRQGSIISELEVREAIVNLRAAMELLEPRPRQILRLRFGLEDGKERTLREIGTIFEISEERVRQIQIDAMNRIQAATIR